MLMRVRRSLLGALRRIGLADRALDLRRRFRNRQHHVGDRIRRLTAPHAIRSAAGDERFAFATYRPPRRSPRTVVVTVRSTPTIVEIIDANATTASSCLAAAGIPARPIETADTERARIAVPVTDRQRLLAALREHGPPSLYLYLDDPAIPWRRALHHVASSGRSLDRLVAKVELVRLFEFFADADATDILGEEHGCEIEFWSPDESTTQLEAARPNLEVLSLPREEFGVHVARRNRLPRTDEITFDIDVVYTWVDGSDPAWIERRDAVLGKRREEHHHGEAVSDARYTSYDELRYSLRSLERYADFVRHVFIVTDAQRPEWLVDHHPRLTVVDHREIFDDHSCLPTFNSHAIESRLHHIPGLSEHYLYLNDDFLFARRVAASSFFHANGVAKFFPSSALVPQGAINSTTKSVDMAAMNGRDLIAREFGRRATQKMRHAPYPQRRSVMLDIERRFPDEVRRTSASRVRSQYDLSMASFLHHHVALLTGLAVPGDLKTDYVDLGRPDLRSALAGVRNRRHIDTLCLNDVDSSTVSRDEKRRALNEALNSWHPEPSSFERA